MAWSFGLKIRDDTVASFTKKGFVIAASIALIMGLATLPASASEPTSGSLSGSGALTTGSLAAGSLSTSAAVDSTAVAAPPAGPQFPVIASGLDNPRGLAFAPNGDLYVAESGHGGDGTCIPSGDDPTVETCYGTSGAITRVHNGTAERVVTGLPSLAPQVATQGGQSPAGAQASGPSSVAVIGTNQIAFTIGFGSDPANRAQFSDASSVGKMLGTLNSATVPANAADVTMLADIAKFEADNNPVPPADAPDSNANSVLPVDDGYLVVDAGGNDLLHVDHQGNVSVIATFPSTTPCPPPPVPPQAVPTAVVQGPDGALYVSELTGFPFCEGGANIYKIDEQGQPQVYAAGLTNVTGLAFGPNGTLYATEIAQHGLQKGPIGAVVAIPEGGGTTMSDYQMLAAGLLAPYGIAIHDGSAYVTTGSILPVTAGGGQVVKISLTPTTGNPACHPFSDVQSSNVHCRNIEWLKGQHITKPVGGKYHPASSVNRGSMTAFLFRALNPNQPAPKCTSKPFPDVSTTSLFCGYIAWAHDNGIAYGYPNGTFKAANAVTRGAMSAFLERAFNPNHPAKKCTVKPFADVATGSTFCGDITWMADNDITYGVGDGTNFGTTRSVNRASMASFLHRAIDYMNS